MMDRPYADVDEFAAAMKLALKANGDKPGWRDRRYSGDWDFWMAKLTEEYVELMVELRRRRYHWTDGPAALESDKRVAAEATDLANIAMMIYANSGSVDLQ